MKYFKNFETLQDLKTQYRAFAKQLHPDCGGDAKAFTEMNAEYQQALEMLERGGAKAYNQRQTVSDEGKAFKAVIDLLLSLKLDVEICGDWIWISGDTHPAKEQLKALHCRWSRNKARWYWAPAYSKTHSRGKTTMESIRAKYGSKWFLHPDDSATPAAY